MARIWIFTLGVLLHVLVQAKPGYNGTDQEWGTLEIRTGAHVFWWLYYVNPPSKPVDFDVYSRPLIIWLQGGPGFGASGLGNFLEIGPVDMDGHDRNTTWVNDYNVLFIDAPVGSGFSHADSPEVFNTNDDEITTDVVSVIKSFFQTFPGFRSVPTYIVGQSYGGRIAVNVAWELYQGSQSVNHNLKGVGLGGPAISILDVLKSTPSYAFNLGFIDAMQRDSVQNLVDRVDEPVRQKNWTEAANKAGAAWTQLWEYTQNLDPNNVLQKWHPNWSRFQQIMENIDFMNSHVKPAMDISNNFGEQTSEVYYSLPATCLKSATDRVDRLLKETDLKEAIYSGQLDLSVPTTSIVAWLDRMFENDKGWANAARKTLIFCPSFFYCKTSDSLQLFTIVPSRIASGLHGIVKL